MPLRPAATVVLLRPEPADPGGLAVFLVQRSRRVGFMPSAWVFPGGRVDEDDQLHDHPRVQGGEAAAAAMGLSHPAAVAFMAAAFRETLEESGIWLGPGGPPPGARRALNEGRTTLAEVLDTHDRVANLDDLIPWSWWVTPTAEPRRYDTRFFVARVDTDEGRHDEGETVDSAWMPLSEAVARADAGELPMAPPTWWTLHQVAAAVAPGGPGLEVGASPARAICPVLRKAEGGLELVLPGHEDHEDPAIHGLPSRITFGQGRWWAKGCPDGSLRPRLP